MLSEFIFFDANSTTALSDAAKNAMNELTQVPYNPSAVHAYGRNARKILEDAKKNILKNLGLDNSYKITFTGSGTEANNMVFAGLPGHVAIISAMEHKSVYKSADKYCEFDIVNINQSGLVNLVDLEEKLQRNSDKKMIVSVMYANNETGVLQDMKTISELVKKYNAKLHTDAIQVIGKCEFNFAATNFDIITLSAHKFGGPAGIGAIIYKSNIHLEGMIVGGGQEMGVRSGTQNVVGAVGFAAALSDTIASKNLDHVLNIRNHIEQKIKEICAEVIIISDDSKRLVNTVMIAMPNVSSEVQIMSFDMAGIAVSAGSACSSGKTEVSYVLLAMGVAEELAGCAIRISLAKSVTIEQADKFLQVWQEIYNKNKYKKAC